MAITIKGEIILTNIFRTVDGQIHKISEQQKGCWIDVTSPTESELLEISEKYNIDMKHLKAPLDKEECSRIKTYDSYQIILVDVPILEEYNGKESYVTVPLAIFVTDDVVVTVCQEDTSVLDAFINGRVEEFFSYKSTRFVLQILNKNVAVYLQYLKIIDKKSEIVGKRLHCSTKNRELIELLELEKSLVYFVASLRANELVLESLLKMDNIKKYPQDKELLEDVIIENRRAMEMASIYSEILNGTMDAFASVISNNLNSVMKFLATVTIVMSIPTMIASFYGMNVNVNGIPWASSSYGFSYVVAFSIILTIIATMILAKFDLF